MRLKSYISTIKTYIDTKRGLTKRGSGRKSRLPIVGETILACCPGEAWKTVSKVDVWSDTIEYDDGTTDSLQHCGWLTYEDYSKGIY